MSLASSAAPAREIEALAVLFSDDNMTCATLPDYEAATSGIIASMGAFTSGGLTGGSDDQMTAEELAVLPTLFSFGRKICGLPPVTAASRARKMTDARPTDASKVHKLAAAILRSTKTVVTAWLS